MQTRFKPDPILVKGVPIIFGILFFLMVVFSLLTGFRTSQIVGFLVSESLVFLLWLGLSRGSYTEVGDEYIQGKVLFFPGRTIRIADIVSIQKKGINMGFQAEINMMVREENGTMKERGLVGKPWLTEEDLKKLIGVLKAKNPNIKIDENIFSK